MSTWTLLCRVWDPHPTVLAGCGALALAYWLALPERGLMMWSFLLGTTILALALVSPLDALGDRYLFVAHMLQHPLLLLAVPPLLLLRLPRQATDGALRRAPLAHAERVFGAPAIAWPLGIGAMWLWHLPALYGLALRSQPVHVWQHLTFLVSSTVFWWPVLAPVRRLSRPFAILYLLGASLASALLGIIITFAPVGLYPTYAAGTGDLAVLRLIRDGWRLDAAADQQLGGLLMWVPGGGVYLLAMLAIVIRWLDEAEPRMAGERGAGPAIAGLSSN